MTFLDFLVPILCGGVLCLPLGFYAGILAYDWLEKDNALEKQGENE